MHGKSAIADRRVAMLARRQHGVVSIRQLRESGLTEGAVRVRVLAGRLHRVHRGVYAVGHTALSHEALCMSAVLACGTGGGAGGHVLDHWGAAVSHRSAASLWGLLAWEEGPIDVAVPGENGRRRRAGIRVHRIRRLVAADVTLHGAVPVTTPGCTISDLRRVMSRATRQPRISPPELRRAVRQATVLGLPNGEDLSLERTRSDLELEFLGICRRHGIPEPQVNVRIGRLEVDFLWAASRVVVETDGYRFHRGRAAFEADHARDLELREQGYTVIRLSGSQVTDEAARVARLVREAVGAAT